MKLLHILSFFVGMMLIVGMLYCTDHRHFKKPIVQLGIKPVSECYSNVCIEVNPNIELVEIVFYLAGWNNFPNMDYTYVKDVNLYFRDYQNSSAVMLAKKAIKAGLIYDAIPKFALELDNRTWNKNMLNRVNNNEKLLNELALAINKFANNTNFTKFYTDHRLFYDDQIRLFVQEHPEYKEIPKFIESFFGRKKNKWIFILQPLQFHYSYAGPEKQEMYAFLGICSFINNTTPLYCNASAHEFAHAFVNPEVEKFYSLFKPYHKMFLPVEDIMKNMGYATWKVYLQETFVRAFEAYYLEKTGKIRSLQTFLKKQENIGFYLVKYVYNAYINEYVPQRDKYKTFEDFMPRLAELTGRWYEEGFWKNVSPEPTIGSVFYSFLSGKIGIYFSGGAHVKEYAEHYMEKLQKAGFKVKMAKNANEKENMIIITVASSSVVQELDKYTHLKFTNNSIIGLSTGRVYKGKFLAIEAIRNPWNKKGFILLIVGTTDNVFSIEKNREEKNSRILSCHYAIYNKEERKIVECG